MQVMLYHSISIRRYRIDSWHGVAGIRSNVLPLLLVVVVVVVVCYCLTFLYPYLISVCMYLICRVMQLMDLADSHLSQVMYETNRALCICD